MPAQMESDMTQVDFKIGGEISVTGKWLPRTPGGIFRKSPDSADFLNEWEDIHTDARADKGVLQTEINHAIGEDAVLVHHVFKNADALLNYFGSTASTHAEALLKVAKPQLHLIRGIDVTDDVAKALTSRGVPLSIGNFSYGFVRDYAEADPAIAIHATAKWTCKPGSKQETLDELKHWWQMANNHAFEHEPGLRRFEVYEADGEHAVITHDTFDSTEDLKFHLTKGAANKYKAHIDKIAVPENYYFRGPVEWMIRTYSKFMHLPATYSTLGSFHAEPGGSMSSGTTV